MNRPEAMNALNVSLVSQLGEIVDEINSRVDISTVVFEGAGKAFVAGADVKFFVDKLREDSFRDIYEFTSDGHDVLNSIEKCEKTTIALTTGLALGGGLELALSVITGLVLEEDSIQISRNIDRNLPWTWRELKRTARICGVECARYAVLAGNFLDSSTALRSRSADT